MTGLLELSGFLMLLAGFFGVFSVYAWKRWNQAIGVLLSFVLFAVGVVGLILTVTFSWFF